MINNEDRITTTELITTYVFLAIMIAIMFVCAWVIFSSWEWTIV